MRKADLLLSLFGLIEAAWLAAILVRRKAHREFPFFFVYVACSIGFIVLRLSVSGNYQLFFLVSWGTEAIYVLLALLALHEVFRKVFMPFYQKWWFWLFFPCAVIAISVLAVIYRFGSPPVQAIPVISLILSLGTAVSLVQIALFGLFFLLVWFHGIRWRDYSFGIVVGFAMLAVGALWGNWARSIFGTKFNRFFGYAPSVAYICAVIWWLATFLRPRVEPKWSLQITPKQLLEEVRQYAKIIARLRGRRE
jgi:hypothetical protein